MNSVVESESAGCIDGIMTETTDRKVMSFADTGQTDTYGLTNDASAGMGEQNYSMWKYDMMLIHGKIGRISCRQRKSVVLLS